MLIEDWSLFDAVYMTVITVTTVGFGEVKQLSQAGRFFTIMLVISGMAVVLYVTSALVQFFVEGQIREILGRRKLDKKLSTLKNHFIVCGYGRIGRVICNQFKGYGIDPVVIENDPDLVELMVKDKTLYVTGDATEEDILLRAGIRRARCIIAVLATDTDNVFLVLTARQLNPKIYIIARASSNKAKNKLLAAGANRVESPYEIGAVTMAQRILRPSVANFIELVFAYDRKDIKMEEIPVSSKSPLAGLNLKDSGIRQKYNLIIIAIKKPDGEMLFNPSFNTVIEANDTVIAMGKSENLKELERALMAAA